MPRLVAVCVFVVLAASAAHLEAAGRAASRPPEVKFIVQPKPEHGRVLRTGDLVQEGARIVVSYDSMTHVVAVPEAARDGFERRMAEKSLELRELESVIRTPRRLIDARATPPPSPLLPGLYLLQYAAPPSAAWVNTLSETGAVVIQSLPDRAVVIAATGNQVSEIDRHPWVDYIAAYTPESKFAPAGVDRGEFVIQIADTPSSSDAIANIDALVGGFVVQSSSDHLLTARIRTDRATATELLSEPFVLGVETYVAPQPSDERQALSLTGGSSLAAAVTIANSGTATGTNYRKWLNKYGFSASALTASNIVVDIADTGLINGCSADTGSARAHLDLRGRVVYHNGATTPTGELGSSKSPSYMDSQGHGTVVASIVAGNPQSGIDTSGQLTNGLNMKDSDAHGQFFWGMGVAPGIRIGSTVMMNSSQQGQVVDWTTRAVSRYCNTPTAACTPTAALCRATVQNHSNNEYEETGANAGFYTTSAQLFDKSVRRADHATNIPLAVTVSAGNIRQFANDPSVTVLAPATAKNVISVGAVESVRSSIPSACLNDLAQGDNPHLRNKAEGYNVLAYGSRRGTADNRMKPDLLAPATLAVGARAYYGGLYCLNTGGTQPGEPVYHGASGTSFAAPVAAGSIALLRHFYSTNHGFVPSPAMYKAMLVAGGRSITGGTDRYTAGTVTKWPNVQQGFGAIALDNLFNGSVARGWRDQQAVLLQSQSSYYNVTVGDPSKPVKIVLTWTDAPGAVQQPGQYLTKALVNDLDLRATWPDGLQYYGNAINTVGYSYVPTCSRGTCVPADVLNNVEVLNIDPVRFAGGANTSFTVRVWAAVVNGIGVPGVSGGANNQDFALFVINGSLTPQCEANCQ